MLAGLRLASALFYILSLSLLHSADALVVPRHASLVTLPLARRLNMTGAANIVKLDQARAKALKEGAKLNTGGSPLASMFHVPVDNDAISYVTSIGVGTPPTQYSLIVDTGSSNTWVGAQVLDNPYKPSSSTKRTGNLVKVSYGSGFFTGVEVTDTVTLAPGFVIQNQSVGVATASEGLDDVDGILGIGPEDLTIGTLSPATTESVPTVVENAFSQGLIPTKEISISFVPTTTVAEADGELTFGGVDPSKFTGEITYVPITDTDPASRYVGIDQTITYGPFYSLILEETAGITDTGTTLVLLASDAFTRYQDLTGAVPDSTTGLLRITPAQFEHLESLFFTIGNTTYEFTPNAQIFPRALNTAIGGQPGAIYLIVGDIGSSSGQGLDFINGYAFLQRFYQVYDITNNRVGFATTQYTNATTN